MSKKVFITGIAGFVGSSLCRALLKEGFEVYGIDNLKSGYQKNLPLEATWLQGDIRDWEQLQKINQEFDIVVNLAAQTSGEKSFEIPDYDLETNLKGSLNVYKFAIKCGAKLLINMSSMSVYGDLESNILASEKMYPEPVSPYGNSKHSAERLLNIMSKVDNLPVVNLRLFNAYGPNQDLTEMKQGMVSIYLSYFLNYEKIQVKGSLNRVRDFIYIDDITSAIITIIGSEDYRNETYNLSTGVATRVEEVLNQMKLCTGKNKEIVSSGFTFGDVNGFAGDNTKIKSHFDWQPKISIEDGIKKMVNFYMSKI